MSNIGLFVSREDNWLDEAVGRQFEITHVDNTEAALEILEELENNGIVGEAASINVSNLQKIELQYGTKYQVNLGDVNKIDYKIAAMVATIRDPRMKNSMGVLDVSFTTWPDMVGYTPLD